MSAVKDWEAAKGFAEEFIKISNDSNKDLTLFNVPEILPMLKAKNWRLCGQCLSSNCQLIHWISKKSKNQPKFLGQCKGKVITLGEVPNTLEVIKKSITSSKKKAEIDRKKFEKKKVDGNTAEVEPITNNYSNNVADFINANQDLLTGRQTRENTACLNVQSMRLSSLPEITEEILPIWESMSETKKYKCIICGKQKMHKGRYTDHMLFGHMASLEEPDIEEYLIGRAMFETTF